MKSPNPVEKVILSLAIPMQAEEKQHTKLSDLYIFHVEQDHNAPRIWKPSNALLDRPKTPDRWLNIASGLLPREVCSGFILAYFFLKNSSLILKVRMATLKENSKMPWGFDFTILNHYFPIYIIDTSKVQKLH